MIRSEHKIALICLKYIPVIMFLLPIQIIVSLVGPVLFLMLLRKVDRFRNKCVYLDLFIAQERAKV